jgi:tetratricopeptide (TPR) repeat protein
VVAAWAELLDEPKTKRELESRHQVINQLERVSENLELDVLLARAAYYDIYQQPQLAVECLNQAVALQPSFLPALVEKAKVLMATGDWDLALEVVMRVLSQDQEDVEGLRLMALYQVMREANAREAAQK